jgi:hypothetical protein
MDIKELHSFKLSDAIKFHDKLNPKLWLGDRLDPAVRKQLLVIAKDFMSELGINDLAVEDVTVSGSNAAYSYTPHSDLDLHILVDMSKLPEDEVYSELFNAKKVLYNDSHDITIRGVPVELYVQDSNQPVVSLGEYSLLKNKWIKYPTKRRANLDQNATKAKFEKMAEMIDLAFKTRNLERVEKVIKNIKRYRQAGLDKGGEFSPENLAYKVARNQGAIQKLYDLRDKLHSEQLSIDEMYTGPKMKFLRPGELRGSYSDYQLLGMGFKKSQNGSWYIPQVKWDQLIKAGQIGEAFDGELTETFDQPYPITWEKGDFADYDALAKMPDGKYLHVMFNNEGDGEFHIHFYRNNSQEVTGEGDAQRIFATVLTAIQQFVEKEDPQRLVFSASKEVDPGQKSQSRAKLYDKMVQRYAKSLGYRAFRAETNNIVRYELSKLKKDVSEASGYIPSEKQKNDPRWKTALTVDVKPDAIKKNAKAFSWLTDRAGIPPTAKPNGKI